MVPGTVSNSAEAAGLWLLLLVLFFNVSQEKEEQKPGGAAPRWDKLMEASGTRPGCVSFLRLPKQSTSNWVALSNRNDLSSYSSRMCQKSEIKLSAGRAPSNAPGSHLSFPRAPDGSKKWFLSPVSPSIFPGLSQCLKPPFLFSKDPNYWIKGPPIQDDLISRALT